MQSKLFISVIRAATLASWAIAVSFGAGILLHYSNTPGEPAAPPVYWPAETSIVRSQSHSTLLLFAHPQCPCSESSMEEVAQIVASTNRNVDVRVLFYAPESEPVDWVRGRLWNHAAIIPGLQMIEDRDGLETQRFHVSTSGQALLYDSTGRLQFNGGITASRGHAGANDGTDAIISFIQTGSAPRSSTHVFGCSLLRVPAGRKS